MGKIAAAAFILINVLRPLNADTVLFQSATLGAPCSLCGSGVDSTQFLGARFHLDSPVQVDAVGGSLFVFSSEAGSTVFGAIVSLDTPFSLPSASPFSFVPLAVTLLHPGTTSSDVKASLSANLGPGDYALIFGTQRFGASAGSVGGLADSGTPTDDSSRFFSQFDQWFNGGSPLGERFVVYGEAIPEPSYLRLIGVALVMIGGRSWIRRFGPELRLWPTSSTR